MEKEHEFILRDILDDLKALRANNTEWQNDFVSISDRLNTFEKLLKEQKQIIGSISTKPVEEVITREMLQLKNFTASKNSNKRIEHKHHLHKGLFISLLLTVLCILLSFGWYKSYNASKQLKASDIKYRALKVVGNKSLLKLLHYTDSLYFINCDSFELKVNSGEKKLQHNKNH